MVLTLFILVSTVDPPDLFWFKMAAVGGRKETHLLRFMLLARHAFEPSDLI